MTDKVQERLNRQQELHFNKTQNSYSEFKNARVTSCSAVLMKGGHTVALAFQSPNAKPIDIGALKSSETVSVCQ